MLTRVLIHQTPPADLVVLVSPNEGDWYLGPAARYQVTDALSATLGLNLFGGPRRAEFGQFADDSNICGSCGTPSELRRPGIRDGLCDWHPVDLGCYSVVTVILGLEFSADPGQTLEEARRILKPGARLVVAILNRTGLWTLWRRLKRRLVRSLWRDATFFTAEDLRGLLETRGFVDLRWRGAVHFLPLCRTRGVAWLARWETLAARWAPGRATFLAVAARRP